MTFGDYSKVNFQYPQGTKFKQAFIKSDTSASLITDHVINPSVVIYGWIPTKGDGNTLNSGTMFASKAAGSPVNVALLDYYEKLRSQNSSLSAYSPADVGKVLFALESLYGLLAEEETDIISLVDSRYDTYAHRGLLRKALWSNPDLAAKNVSNLISRHNLQAKKLQAFPFIPGVPFLKDHLDWASCVYQDDNLTKSSIFLFRRSGYYYWEVNSTDPDPGFLMLRDDIANYGYFDLTTPFKAEKRMDIVDYLIDSYLIDDDLANISAEIYKAYGLKPEEYHVNLLPADITGLKIEEKYDLDMIDAVKNSDFHYLDGSRNNSTSIYGIGEDTNGNLVYAVGSASGLSDVFPINALSLNGQGAYTVIDTGEGRLLYSYEINPSGEAIRDLTRFTHIYKNISDSKSYVYGLKTEYLTGIEIHWYDPDQVTPFQSRRLTRFVENASNTAGVSDLMRILSPLTAVPNFYSVAISGDRYTGTYYAFRKDIDNLGLIDNSALIIYSELEMCYSFFTTNKGQRNFGKKEKKRNKTAKKEAKADEDSKQ